MGFANHTIYGFVWFANLILAFPRQNAEKLGFRCRNPAKTSESEGFAPEMMSESDVLSTEKMSKSTGLMVDYAIWAGFAMPF